MDCVLEDRACQGMTRDTMRVCAQSRTGRRFDSWPCFTVQIRITASFDKSESDQDRPEELRAAAESRQLKLTESRQLN